MTLTKFHSCLKGGGGGAALKEACDSDRQYGLWYLVLDKSEMIQKIVLQGEGSVCDLLPKQWFIAPNNNDFSM